MVHSWEISPVDHTEWDLTKARLPKPKKKQQWRILNISEQAYVVRVYIKFKY